MIQREKGSGLTVMFSLLLLLLLIATAAVLFFARGSTGSINSDAKLLSYSNQAQNLAVHMQNAVSGSVHAFDEIKRRRALLDTAAEVEQVASTSKGIRVEDVRRAWGRLLVGVDEVLAGEQTLGEVQNSAAQMERQLPALLSDIGNLASSFAPRALQGFTPVLNNFERSTRDLLRNLDAASGSAGISDNLASDMNQSVMSMRTVIDALSGNTIMAGVPAVSDAAASDTLSAAQVKLDQIESEVSALLSQGEALTAIHRGAEQATAASEGIYQAVSSVRNRVVSVGGPGILQSSWLPLGLLGGALLSALGYMLFARRQVSATMGAVQTEAVEQTDKHQEAILRLLDEMGDLADGDLTVEATITEDITGAIADSINYAIEALRDLVSTIDEAAESVDSAAQQTQAAANHLAKASENQSTQVSSATESITQMAQSIEQVSTNAERSSEVSRHSVEIAHKGGEAVRRTIDGMNTIRETIQDTSKRIKRLGESSQEIGNIVELINDIAEQTNILALNASIQASMAGEAGRGFGVVADEVQRLAERSANATKQIEVLVRTIQSDTNEAVVSMERSTTDVVSGALLAENAGAALDEIEKVSNQIASLVQNISGSAKQQATVAGDVTRNMGVLQEISAQTAENTNATSRSIGNLAEMASRLKHSVAGFKLPKEAEPVVETNYDEMLSDLASEENEFIDTLIVRETNKS